MTHAPRPALSALFIGFLSIGMMSFGGGLAAWTRREVVQRRGWLDDPAFLSGYGLSQLVPGATNVNLAVFIGTQLRGIPGAFAALAGLVTLPLLIVLAVGAIYLRTQNLPGGAWVSGALAGMGAVAIGLSLGTGIRLGRRNITRAIPAAITAVVALSIGVFGYSLVHVLLVMMPVSLVLAWWAGAAMSQLLQLALLFAGLSMLAFGGGAGVLPDMQRATVDQYHWLTAGQFLDMFAISRAAPGPGSLIVVLIGQKVAGLPGAAVSFAAMFGPSCLLVHIVARFWHRAAHAAWRRVLEQALAPVAVGLTFASGLALMRSTEHGVAAYAVTAASTAAFAFTEINPLILLGCGAVALLAAGG